MAARSTSATAQFKRFTATMRVVKRIAYVRESLMSALANLGEVERFMLEQLDIPIDDDESPASPKSNSSPASAPTRFNPAWDSSAFEKHVLTTYKEASSEAERQLARALVEKGVTANLLTPKQAQDLLAKLK